MKIMEVPIYFLVKMQKETLFENMSLKNWYGSFFRLLLQIIESFFNNKSYSLSIIIKILKLPILRSLFF